MIRGKIARFCALGWMLGLVLVVASACRSAPEPAPRDPLEAVDFTAEQTALRSLLVRLLRTDSSQPERVDAMPARVLQAYFRRSKLPSQLVTDAHGALSLVAELRGRQGAGGGDRILLISHLDTAPVDPTAWSAEIMPLRLTEKGGALHGLGLLGGKGLSAVQAVSLVALAESGIRFEQDIVLIALGRGRSGSQASLEAILKARPELGQRVVLALGPGGPRVQNLLGDDREVQLVAAGDRGLARFELAALRRSDGSQSNTIERLSKALLKVEQYPLAPVLSEIGHRMVQATLPKNAFVARMMATSEALSKGSLLTRSLERPLMAPSFVSELRTLAVEAGLAHKESPPGRARAWVDARLQPELSAGQLRRDLRLHIGDPDLHISILLGRPATTSPLQNWVYETIAEQLSAPGVVLSPAMNPAPSGVGPLRELGIPVYGVSPWLLDIEATRRPASQSARIQAKALGIGLERYVRLIHALSQKVPAKTEAK